MRLATAIIYQFQCIMRWSMSTAPREITSFSSNGMQLKLKLSLNAAFPCNPMIHKRHTQSKASHLNVQHTYNLCSATRKPEVLCYLIFNYNDISW